MDKSKKDYSKDVEFLNELAKPDRKIDDTEIFTIGKVDSRKFYKSKGITKNTLKQVAEANNDLINCAIKHSSDKLSEAEKGINRVFTSIYTDFGKFEARSSKRPKKVRNPQTGEESIKPVSITAVAVIKPLLNKQLIKDCEDQIKKHIKL